MKNNLRGHTLRVRATKTGYMNVMLQVSFESRNKIYFSELERLNK